MRLKFIPSFVILQILITFSLFYYPVLIFGHETTLSKQSGDQTGKTCHQRHKNAENEELDSETNYCDDVKLETIQTYAVPIDELEKGMYRPILAPEGSSILPPWLNVTLYNTGVHFSRKHFFSVFLFPIAAISMFVSNPFITPLLMATGKSSTPPTSYRRYVATVLHMKMWYENLLQEDEDTEKNKNSDAIGDELLNPFVLQSLYNIRGVHFNLIKNHPWSPKSNNGSAKSKDEQEFATNPKLWEAFKADLDGSEIPQKYRDWPQYIKNLDGKGNPPPHYLNQLSLGMTQFFLGGLQTLMPERGGIVATDEEHKGFLHMWAVLGYAIGIEDQFNVALQPSLPAARAYYQEMMNRFLYPSFFYMLENQDAQILYETFLEGFVIAFEEDGKSPMTPEQFMLLAFEDVFGIPCPNLRAQLGIKQRLMRTVFLQNAVTLIRNFDWAREFMNRRFQSQYCEVGARKLFGIDATDLEQVVEKSYA